MSLCQNDDDITRTALFIKKLQIENSKNWMKIEELVSCGYLKKLLKTVFSRRTYENYTNFYGQRKLYLLHKLRKSSKKTTKNS